MYENQTRVVGTIITAGLGQASTGTDQIAVLFEYVENGETKRINWYGYFSDKAVEYANEALEAMGWNPAEHSWDYFLLNEKDPEKNPLVGKRAQLVLDDEEDLNTGEMRKKVKFVNSLGGGLGLKERMDENSARAFSARMRAKMTGAAPAAPRPKPAARPADRPAATPTQQFSEADVARAKAAGVGGPDDSDVPF